MNDYVYADLEEAARWADAENDFAEYLEEELYRAYQDVGDTNDIPDEGDTFMSTEVISEMSYSTFVCMCGEIFMVADQDPFLVDDNSKLKVSTICLKCEEEVRTKANRQKFVKPNSCLSNFYLQIFYPQILKDEFFYNSLSFNNRQWFFNCTLWHRDGSNLGRKGL